MAFCRYCGNQIEDGATCPCRQNAQPETEINVDTQNGSGQVTEQMAAIASKAGTAAKNALNEFVPYLKSYIKMPKATVKDAIGKNKFSVAVGFVIINALAVIIAMWSLLGSIASVISGGSAMLGAKVDIDLPVFRFILAGIVISFVVMALAALALFLFAKVGGAALSYRGAYIATAFHSFWPTVIIFGGNVIALVGGPVGLLLAIAAISFAIMMIYITAVSDAKDLAGYDVTSTSGKMFLAPVLVIAACTAIGLVIGMLFSWCIMGVEVGGVSISGGLSGIGKMY